MKFKNPLKNIPLQLTGELSLFGIIKVSLTLSGKRCESPTPLSTNYLTLKDIPGLKQHANIHPTCLAVPEHQVEDMLKLQHYDAPLLLELLRSSQQLLSTNRLSRAALSLPSYRAWYTSPPLSVCAYRYSTLLAMQPASQAYEANFNPIDLSPLASATIGQRPFIA